MMTFLYSSWRDVRPDKSVVMPHLCLPYFGNMGFIIWRKFIGKQILLDTYSKIRKYGKYWFSIPAVGMELVISDPPTVKLILEDLDSFIISPVRSAIFGDLFGQGIFLSNGESWAYQRNLARPIFGVGPRTEMFEVYHKCAKNLVSLLNEHYEKKKPIELQQLFKRFTLDTFGEIGFGYCIDSLIKPVPFSTAFDWVQAEAENRVTLPWRKFTHGREWKKHLEEIENFLQQIIEKRRKEGWEGKSDFLSSLLEMESKKEINGVTSKFLRDQVVNFLVAGRDTTAILLSATFYYLSLYPDVDNKVRQEINEIVGNEIVTMKHTKELKYLQNVIDESLRLFPPAVPFNTRLSTKDITLPNKVWIPKGTTIMYSPYWIHRLKEYWGDDAEEFKPERWEQKDILKHPYQYVPFQKGPRICLGMNMAQEEAKCCIAILYQNHFKLELVSPAESLQYAGMAILYSKDGINVNVNKLN
uniref:Cytochrome P450 n=1 Tax=Arcella intermedia TaxID=1963864 RepID=A0A6B2L3D7_9EUKA